MSEQTGQQMKELLDIDEEKIATILNGFDPDIFKPQNVSREDVFKRFDLPATDYLISFTGKLAHF